MPAEITGIVFDDLNGNGIYDVGDPGIPNALLILEDPNGVCSSTQTDGTGNYSFSNLTVPGTYNVYEVVTSAAFTCPPVTFTQPPGFNASTTPRTITQDITLADINNNVIFSDQNFGHENITVWECDPDGLQVAESPSSLYRINLVTGAASNLGLLNPIEQYNAIGFNTLDNTIWGVNVNAPVGSVVRINPDLTVSQFPVEGLPTSFLNTGDVDFNGRLYLYFNNENLFYVVDVDPNSPTFLKQVDPTNGFIEATPPYGTPIVPLVIGDWAFNPVDQQLYAVRSNGQAVRVNPLTGGVTNLATVGIPAGSFGAAFFDVAGAMYVINNPNGNIYRITFSGANATGSLFSTTIPAANNDGARCAFAPLPLLEVVKSVDSGTGCPGDTLTFTSVVGNVGTTLDAANVIFTDDIPDGTTFVPGSTIVGGMPVLDNPANGISIGNIAPGGSVTISFQVTINTLPVPSYPITNISRAVGDNAPEVQSNEVQVVQGVKDVSVEKSASPTSVDVGDVITFTVVVTNNDTDLITNLIFYDTEPSGTNFIPNSVLINGILRPGENPNAGIAIDNLAPGESVEFIFRVSVESAEGFIANTAEVNYCVNQIEESNQVIITIC